MVVPKRNSNIAAQVTLTRPGANDIVSIGSGHADITACAPLITQTHDAIPVYIKTTSDVAVDNDFTIVVPAQ